MNFLFLDKGSEGDAMYETLLYCRWWLACLLIVRSVVVLWRGAQGPRSFIHSFIHSFTLKLVSPSILLPSIHLHLNTIVSHSHAHTNFAFWGRTTYGLSLGQSTYIGESQSVSQSARNLWVGRELGEGPSVRKAWVGWVECVSESERFD